MAKYEELKGVPNKCLNTSPLTIDPIKIRAPYSGIDKAVIEQPGIISVDWPNIDGKSAWELFTHFWQGKNQDAVRGIGWETGAELDAGQKLLNLAKRVINKKAEYDSKYRAKIVSLTQEAKKRLEFISDRYKYWNGIGWPAKSGIGTPFVQLSLKYSNDEIQSRLKDPGSHGHIWPAQRDDARKQIRAAWDKALRLLWCAVYMANQSKAYLKNKSMSLDGVVLKATPVIGTVQAIPVDTVKKVTMIPLTLEPDFEPGGVAEGEIVEEGEEELKPKKKKGMGLVVAGVAAVALLAMKK
jgi:hypothetical protein